jgi:hypothetical protein
MDRIAIELINRRARNFALSAPFIELEQNKLRVDHRHLLEHVDLFLVASAMMDTVITEMGGLDGGSTYARILESVEPVVMKAATANGKALSPTDVDKVVSHVVDYLSQSNHPQGIFRREYMALTLDGGVEKLAAEFRILELSDVGGDDYVYKASPEAIHLCLHAFTEEVEVAEAAHAAVVEYYIKTRRHLEAGAAARAAMQRTLQYRAKLREMLAVAQRDITTLNYRTEVLPEFNRSLDHIAERLAWEGTQFGELQARLASQALPPADQQALASACSDLNLASTHHTDLMATVQTTSRHLLDIHGQQGFSSPLLTRTPRPTEEVIEPLVKQSVAALKPAMAECFPRYLPIRIPKFLDLESLLDAMLRVVPHDQATNETAEIPETIELPDVETFTKEVQEAGMALIYSLPSSFTLSEAITAAQRAPGATREIVRFVAIVLTQHFDDSDTSGFVVSLAGRPICAGNYYGDELHFNHVSE